MPLSVSLFCLYLFRDVPYSHHTEEEDGGASWPHSVEGYGVWRDPLQEDHPAPHRDSGERLLCCAPWEDMTMKYEIFRRVCKISMFLWILAATRCTLVSLQSWDCKGLPLEGTHALLLVQLLIWWVSHLNQYDLLMNQTDMGRTIWQTVEVQVHSLTHLRKCFEWPSHSRITVWSSCVYPSLWPMGVS